MHDWVGLLVDTLAVIGALDVILGVIVKHTKTKIDDNIYAIFHRIVTAITAALPWGKK